MHLALLSVSVEGINVKHTAVCIFYKVNWSRTAFAVLLQDASIPPSSNY